MFFLCPVARYVWHVIKCTFSLQEIPSVFYDIPVWISKLPVSSRGLVACGVAAVVWSIWKTRNNACFNGIIMPSDPTGIVCPILHYIDYWSGLQRQKVKKLCRKAARILVMVAQEFFSQRQGCAPAHMGQALLQTPIKRNPFFHM